MNDADTLPPRILVDAHGSAVEIAFDLHRGRTYRVVASARGQRAGIIRSLEAAADTAVVRPDGGLISNLRVWENLALPLEYHDLPGSETIESRALEVFLDTGLTADEAARITGLLPDELTRYERCLTSFVRGMLIEPEILVFNAVFDGLTHDETVRVARFHALFRHRLPFRTTVFLGFDHALPDGIRPDAVFRI